MAIRVDVPEMVGQEGVPQIGNPPSALLFNSRIGENSSAGTVLMAFRTFASVMSLRFALVITKRVFSRRIRNPCLIWRGEAAVPSSLTFPVPCRVIQVESEPPTTFRCGYLTSKTGPYGIHLQNLFKEIKLKHVWFDL